MPKGLPRSTDLGDPTKRLVTYDFLIDEEINITDGNNAWGSLHLGGLPKENVIILCRFGSFVFEAEGAGIRNNWNGDVSIGSAALTAAATTLTGTRADFAGSKALDAGAANKIANQNFNKGTHGTAADFKARGNAVKPLYMNVLVDNADSSANATMKIRGNLKIICIVV